MCIALYVYIFYSIAFSLVFLGRCKCCTSVSSSESCTLWNIGSFVGCVRILYMTDNGHRTDKRNVILICVCVF